MTIVSLFMLPLRRALTRQAITALAVTLMAPAVGTMPMLRAQSGPGGSAAPLETVGRLTGDDVTVTGAVSFDVESGRSTAMLSSGSDVTVRSGQAKLDLVEGGDIAICGPAHFSVLKAGGAITLALDYGRVHPQIDSGVVLTVYTPLIVATPVAIGEGLRDATLGLDQKGGLCALTASGALRIEQQLTGQSLLVPQGGEVDFDGGELSTLRQISGRCSCDLMVASNSSASKQVELSVPIRPPAVRPTPSAAVPPLPPSGDTVYRVDMPPLTFDAKSPTPPADPDPSTMLLVRESRMVPEVFFRGHVEAATPAAAPTPIQASTHPTKNPLAKKPGVLARFFGLFHHSRTTPCAGSGCGDSGP